MRNAARNTGNIKSRQRIKFSTLLVLWSNAPPKVRCGPSNSPLPRQGRGSNARGMPGGGGGGRDVRVSSWSVHNALYIAILTKSKTWKTFAKKSFESVESSLHCALAKFSECVHERTRQWWHMRSHRFGWNLASLKGSPQNYFTPSNWKFEQNGGSWLPPLVFRTKTKKIENIRMIYQILCAGGPSTFSAIYPMGV